MRRRWLRVPAKYRTRALGLAREGEGRGRDGSLREDIALRKAVEFIAEKAAPISAEHAEARDKMWTPEKEPERRPRSSGPPEADAARAAPSIDCGARRTEHERTQR